MIEEGLCGRTTIFDDPLQEGRCGIQMLPAVLETHNPVDITVVMLGTNDCKTIYGATAGFIGKGISRIVRQIRINTGQSKILLISPINLGADVWKSKYDPDFSALSVAISKELPGVYQKVCENENIYFLAASSYANPSSADQEHLDGEGHRLLADAIFKKIREIEEDEADK